MFLPSSKSKVSLAVVFNVSSKLKKEYRRNSFAPMHKVDFNRIVNQSIMSEPNGFAKSIIIYF